MQIETELRFALPRLARRLVLLAWMNHCSCVKLCKLSSVVQRGHLLIPFLDLRRWLLSVASFPTSLAISWLRHCRSHSSFCVLHACCWVCSCLPAVGYALSCLRLPMFFLVLLFCHVSRVVHCSSPLHVLPVELSALKVSASVTGSVFELLILLTL